MPIPAPSDARLHVAAPSASNVPTLTHDWSFDHGLPSHGASPELLSWLTLFKDSLPGKQLPRNIYPGLQPTDSFPQLVDQANRFVKQAHDRGICCEYAQTQLTAGLGIDTDLAAHHLDLVRTHGLVNACALIQKSHAQSYLQPDLVRNEFATFPEFNTLLALAVDGAHIAIPPQWVPNCGLGVTIRPNAVRMAAPVLVRFAQEQALGDVMLVESSAFQKAAAETSTPFSVISVDWVFKPGDKKSDFLGRLIDDYTNCSSPLNTAETFAAMESVYGELRLPQLSNMCDSLLLARARFPGEAIFGLKEDISRAYRRVRLAPSSCLRMVLQLPPTADGTSYYAVRLSQPFGHNASAHGWGVVASHRAQAPWGDHTSAIIRPLRHVRRRPLRLWYPGVSSQVV